MEGQATIHGRVGRCEGASICTARIGVASEVSHVACGFPGAATVSGDRA
jgi:hypothetical protein